MTTIKNPITVTGGGGIRDVINGVIEGCYSSAGPIDANTFIEFVNGRGIGADTRLTATANTNNPLAVRLNNNTVFVSYNDSSTIYGMVCAINGTTISTGAQTILASESGRGIRLFDIDVLSESQVYLAYQTKSNTSNVYSYTGKLINISESSITPESGLLFAGTTNAGLFLNVVALSSTKIFVAYATYDSYPASYSGRIIESPFTTVPGADKKLEFDGGAGTTNHTSFIKIDASRILYRKVSNNDISCMVISANNDNSLIAGASITVANVPSGPTSATILLDNNRALVVYGSIANEKLAIYGVICSISDNGITSNSPTLLRTLDINSVIPLSLAMSSKNKVFIAYVNTSVYGFNCVILDDGFETDEETLLAKLSNTANTIDTISLGDGRIFTAHGNTATNNVYALVSNLSDFLISPASSDSFDGLTKTKCTVETAGAVWALLEMNAPTVSKLKETLNKGIAELYFPVGTEISDTYNDTNSPLIVGTYQTIDGKLAVGLVRKYATSSTQTYGNDANYRTSQVFEFLNNEYLGKCSEELRGAISTSQVPWYDGSSMQQVPGKWHLLSGIEVYGTDNSGEGEPWIYFKNRSTLAQPGNGADSGRAVTRDSGATTNYYLRTRTSNTSVESVASTGAITSITVPSQTRSLLPICYIIQD